MTTLNNECAICHEPQHTNIYTLPECGHMFHTECIITWFRVNHTCPLCKNEGINAHMCARDINHYYKKAISWSKKKNAPEELKKDASKVRDLKAKLKIHYAQNRGLRSSHGKYKIISKEVRKCNSMINNCEYRLHTLKRILANYVRNSLIIPIKREI